MPKIPDHIANNLESRPEYATEEAAARHVLKGLWIEKRDRDRLRLKLQDKQRSDYRITEFDCLLAALTASGARIADMPFHRDGISCATIGKTDELTEVVQTHVGELSRDYAHVVFCRYSNSRDVWIACLTQEQELQFITPPFRVEDSNWNSMRWVVLGVEEFCSSFHDRHEVLEWLRDFVCGD